MMNQMKISECTHIIFGLGLSGLSCARYFDRIGQPFAVLDTRANPPGEKELAKLSNCQSFLFGKNIQLADIPSCKQLIVVQVLA